MRLSFEEAVQAVMDEKRLTYEEASLAVAEHYATVAEDSPETLPLLDDPTSTERIVANEVVAARRLPTKGLKPIELDEPRSAAREVAALEARLQAKAEGDRYRRLSSSFHSHS